MASTTPGSAYGISIARLTKCRSRDRRHTRKYASGTAIATIATAAVADMPKLLNRARRAASWPNMTNS